MDLHRFVLRFPAELIYEEVIDWEERNKNGLMKEDCSGIFSINRSIKQHRTDKLPAKASNFRSTGSFVCVCVSLVPDVVSGSASQSSSANDISSMSTEQTLASDTDSSSIDTLTGPLDECQWTSGSVNIYTNQPSPSSLSLCYFMILCIHAVLSTLKNRSIFLFALFLWSGRSFFNSRLCSTAACSTELGWSFTSLWFILTECTVHD